eukprot:scaffold30569_cov78-Cyclotella_meneghiniana.AAC.3
MVCRVCEPKFTRHPGYGYLVGALPTRLDPRVIGYTQYLPDLSGTGRKIPEYLPVYSLKTRMWRYPSTYPSTDLVSTPYPGTYPRSQITRVANPDCLALPLSGPLFFPISQNYPSYYHQAPLIPTQNFRWDAKFRLLREFHREHGHCMVSHRHKELGRWVSDQRKKYKEETLNPDKISKLEAVGFVWSGLVWSGVQN